MGVLAPGSGENHGLGVGLSSTHMRGDDGSELARPPLHRRAQARQGGLTALRQAELCDHRPGSGAEERPALQRAPR
eukprot:10985027-Alexandrium_andersonii.AAC.1